MASLLEKRAQKGKKIPEKYKVAELPIEKCTGITKTGEVCRRSADKNCSEAYCWQHQENGSKTSPRKSTEKTSEKSPRKSTEKTSEKSPRKSAEKIPEKPPESVVPKKKIQPFDQKNLDALSDAFPNADWTMTGRIPVLVNERDVFSIGHQLGKGAFGEVYEILVNETGARYALKIFNPEVHENYARAETNILSKISQYPRCDPELICLYGIFKRNARGPFSILYELAEGRTLEELINSAQLLPIEQMHVARWLVNTIKKLHNKGIAHRDIKPANIMVEFSPFPPEGYTGEIVNDPLTEDRIESIKLLDFGFACRLASQAREHEVVCRPSAFGTPLYNAPEVYKRDTPPNYFKTDDFSVGATLYEMLEGPDALNKRSTTYTSDEDVAADQGASFKQLPRPRTEPQCFGNVIYGLIQNDPDKRMSLSEASKELKYCNYY